MSAQQVIGRFVRSSVNGLGIGKLQALEGDSVVIEYFDSPVGERVHRKVPKASVELVRLEPQTRVYFLDRQGAWRIGRIEDQVDSNCFIALPNKLQAQRAEPDVYTRWNKPIRDPSEHLAARLTETPFFHEARAELLAGFVEQRAAAAGLTALLSAPIALERHQVEVVRRVLQDPVQRYFLADEVGLGKTIEAGIVIRQYVLDHPTGHAKEHRVLVIAPEQLMGQWESELEERLQVGKRFGHNVRVIALEELVEENATNLSAGLVVIDEAHQAVAGWDRNTQTADGKRFELLRRITAPEVAPRLLLLSATPVRRNEDGFLALLHLLDPAVYRLSDREAFRAKVSQRQALADLFFTFQEDQQSYFLEGMVEELAAMFPGDRRLQALLDRVRPWLEPSAAEDAPERRNSIRAVRTHLSETYRLHRRLLRNRRSSAVEGLLPGRANLSRVVYEDDATREAEEAVERWRMAALGALWGKEESAAAQALGQVYLIFLEAAWCDLEALACCVAARDENADDERACEDYGRLTSRERMALLRETARFEGEKELLQQIWEDIDSTREPNAARLKQLVTTADAHLSKGWRVVVFATSPALADQLHAIANRARRFPVSRHRLDDKAWHAFRDANTPALLVCDYRAEEGLNLQGGKTCMLHADLPFSPNRLEQRIGRLDRFGVGDPVHSFVPKPNECPLFAAWLDCLDGAYQVFGRSIAALQYVVDDEMRQLSKMLLAEGEAALRQSRERLSGPEGVLENELKAIRAQDELDSIEITAAQEETDLTGAIDELEGRSSGMEKACDAWMSERLHFIRVGETSARDNVIRYHYASVRAQGGRATLLPQRQFAGWFGGAVDRGVRHPVFGAPLTRPITFHRDTARLRKVGLGRIGNSVLDALHNYLLWDDRGTCFGIWRYVPGRNNGPPSVYFRFDLLVESGGEALAALHQANPSLSRAALVRRADASFPPMVRHVWLDEDLAFVERPPTEVTRPYDKGTLDSNLNQQRWPLVQQYYDLTNWATRCQEAALAASEALVRTVDLQRIVEARAERLEMETGIIEEQWASRLDALADSQAEAEFAEREREIDQKIRQVLLQDLRAPRVRIDAAGVVFLAGARMP